MTKRILFVGFALLALACVAMAADATGKWTMEQPGRGGGPPRVSTIDLKVDGAKLTGSLTAPGRGGGDPVATPISNGKADGDKISFEVVRQMGGNSMTMKYEFTVKADEMAGKITMPGMDGGEPRVMEVTAKRAK
jgi:hypothetical protein